MQEEEYVEGQNSTVCGNKLYCLLIPITVWCLAMDPNPEIQVDLKQPI